MLAGNTHEFKTKFWMLGCQINQQAAKVFCLVLSGFFPPRIPHAGQTPDLIRSGELEICE